MSVAEVSSEHIVLLSSRFGILVWNSDKNNTQINSSQVGDISIHLSNLLRADFDYSH